MRLLLAIITWFVIVNITFTQELFERKYFDLVWLLNGASIDFEYVPPLVTTVQQSMPFEGTNASICDNVGDLVLITNGIYVGNENGDTITNGDNLNPHPFTVEWTERGIGTPQHAIFLQPTEASNHITLLHSHPIEVLDAVEEQDRFASRNFYLSEYNKLSDAMSIKNYSLLEEDIDIGKINSVRHANGQDWWTLIQKNHSGDFFQFLTGIDSTKYLGGFSTNDSIVSGLGQAYFSPKGDKYARIDMVTLDTDRIVRIFDFDRCAGTLSNPLIIRYNDEALFGGLAFSENGRFLYVASMAFVYQYDLWAEDVEASRFVLSTAPDSWGYFLAGLAPNGKIYISTQGWYPALHVIHHPNRKGIAAEFEHLGLPLPVETSRRTMPNFPYYGLGPLDGSPCDTLGIDNPVPEAVFEYTVQDSSLQVEFFDGSHFMPAYHERVLDARIGWQWDFGDGSALDTTRFPIHTFPADGSYEVCLTVSNVTGADTYCEDVFVGVTSVTEVQPPSNVQVRVWPNPVSESVLYLQVEGTSEMPSTFVLRDTHSRILRRNKTTQNSTALDVANLPIGVYFWEVYQDGLRLANGKVVKVE